MAAVSSSRTAMDVCRSLLSFVQRYGATSLLAGMVPPPNLSRMEQLSHVLLDAWPWEWLQRYFAKGYLYRDPTIRLVQRGSAPFRWREVSDLCPVCPVGRRVMEEAAEFELREGITCSFPTLDHGVLGLSVAAERLELSESDRLSLQFVAAYGLSCALALARGESDRNSALLSNRQREAVAWASEGLTVEDIADRMNISSHTADMHLRLVREKLGVASSIHAVAEAFRRGLIT